MRDLPCPPSLRDTVPYQQQAFQQAQAAKKPILIEIDASWCPTCAKQRPIIAKLQADPAYKDVVVMRVDFDSQKDVVRAMGRNHAIHADRVPRRRRKGPLGRRDRRGRHPRADGQDEGLIRC